MTSKDLESIKTRLEKACKMVHDLCSPLGADNARRWEMSIPARPDSDPDLVIHASLDDIKSLLGEVGRLQGEAKLGNISYKEAIALKEENSRLKESIETEGYKYTALNMAHKRTEELQSESQRYRTALEKIASDENPTSCMAGNPARWCGTVAKEALLPREGNS